MTPTRAARLRQRAVENAIGILKVHPDFPSAQVKILTCAEEVTSNLSAQGRAFFTDARMDYAVRLLDIRAEAYLSLITDLRSQEAYMTILDEFWRGAWREYTGFPIDILEPANGNANLETIFQRARYWTIESYKVLQSLERTPSTTGNGTNQAVTDVNELASEELIPQNALAEASPRDRNTSDNPRVFISYSQDSELHCDRVHALANRLRAEGVEVTFDLYEPNPIEGWPAWMLRQIQESDSILCVCTTTYRERFENPESSATGKGARFEGYVITNAIYQQSGADNKFIPVLFETATSDNIPTILKPRTYYKLDEQYDKLYAHLTHQQQHYKAPIGEIRKIEPHRPSPSDDALSGPGENAKS